MKVMPLAIISTSPPFFNGRKRVFPKIDYHVGKKNFTRQWEGDIQMGGTKECKERIEDGGGGVSLLNFLLNFPQRV